ncbi:MAG: hypothetical protein DME75_13720 [Verrucomicrobia bacterium]|nr:MAG: hypothetical protein DME75_13720 [Verrucomicrobiota bacterium]
MQDRIATTPSSIIIAPRRRMMEIGSILLAGFFFLLAAGYLRGQQDDPSEIFLKAYLSAQQGEKLEHENRLKTALAKYRFAGSLIEELRKSHNDWQPAIVEYRGRKIGEGILRIQERMSRQNDLTTDATHGPSPAPKSWHRKEANGLVKSRATPRSRRQPGKCAPRSINYKRRWKNRAAISRPHERKRSS